MTNQSGHTLTQVNLSFDYYNQFMAIQDLLSRQRLADDNLSQEIDKTERGAMRSTGAANHYAVERGVELMHAAVFQDAAHSMSAAGMLAPTFESIFKDAFRIMGAHFRPAQNEGFAAAVGRFAQQMNLVPYLPTDLDDVLHELFAYRNAMFHNGLEWPRDELRQFSARLANRPVPWFETATNDGDPWMFYLSRAFVDRCVGVMEEVFVGIEYFLVDESRKARGLPPVDKREWTAFNEIPFRFRDNGDDWESTGE